MMENEFIWIVLAVKKNIEILGQTVPFEQKSDGIIGYLPVFGTEENAKKWSNGKAEVMPLREVDE